MTYGPLNGKMVEFKYDARNRLIEAGTTTYQYDAENNRIGKTENGKQTTYIVDTTSSALSRVLVEKQGNTVRQYIYATGLIMHVEGGEYATYHYDNRGSTVAITNSQGKVTDTFTYGPYGEQYGRTGKTRTPFLYNGRYGVETDKNGLYYMRARYYNPDIKRFINQDVVQGSLDNAIALNRFAYANGNPVSLIDPFGLSSQNPYEVGTTAHFRTMDSQKTAHKDANQRARESFENLMAKTPSTPKIKVNNYLEYRRNQVEEDFKLDIQMSDALTKQYFPLVPKEVGRVAYWLKYKANGAAVYGEALFLGATGKSIESYLTSDDIEWSQFAGSAYSYSMSYVASEAALGSLSKARIPSLKRVGKSDNIVYRAINQKDYDRLKQGLGLEAKNPNGTWGLKEHLVNGSNKSSWVNDPFISTTTDINVARGFNQNGNNLGIIAIDLNKVPLQTFKGFELFPRVNGIEGLPYHYSIWQQEISIYQNIPIEAIKGFVK